MSVDNFMPQVWSAALMTSLKKALVMKNLVNTDYIGDIHEAGDTVRINAVGAIAVNDYVKNVTSVEPELLDGGQAIMKIDQSRYYAFRLDDVDNAQSRPKLIAGAMEEAAYALADEVDVYITSLCSDAGTSLGSDGSPKDFDKASPDDPYDVLVDAGVALTEKNVPKIGRWAVVPPWYYGLLLKDDKFINATESGNIMRNTGMIGYVNGMEIYESNNLTKSGSVYRVMVGTRQAITYADQLTKTEAYRMEKSFSDAVRGLLLFGAKVVRPDALVTVHVEKPA